MLLLDDKTSEIEDLQLQSIAHGVVSLEQLSPEYGAERRRLRVMKLRGQKYRGGYHDFVIDAGGSTSSRGSSPPSTTAARTRGCSRAGNAEFDALLGRGLRRTGPARSCSAPPGAANRRSPSSTPGPRRAAASGPSSSPSTSGSRPSSSGRRASGWTSRRTIESGPHRRPARSTRPSSRPGEFAHRVRRAAEGDGGKPGAKVVVIDSLNGYLNAMPEERFLIAQLHELLTYLGHKGVVTFLVVAQHGLLGSTMQTPVDTSYLADTVILFRYFEAMGEVRQAISVVKKRSGRHERTIREFRMDDSGIHVGAPLARLPRHPDRDPDPHRGRRSATGRPTMTDPEPPSPRGAGPPARPHGEGRRGDPETSSPRRA